jgi:hypothetical protein
MTGAIAPSLAVALVAGRGPEPRKERQVFSVEQRTGEPPSCLGTSDEEKTGHHREAVHGQRNLLGQVGFFTVSPHGDPDTAGNLE